MYRHADHTIIGYPYTDHLPLLDLTETAQPYISSECLTANYSGESGLNTMGYNSECENEGIIYMSHEDLSPGVLQRSMSSHSLPKNINTYKNNNNNNNGWFSRMGLVSESGSESNPVRRVFSTGDLQMIKAAQRYSQSESSLSSESSSIIESMTKTCPYSPEEKKERIERYKSKRIQRNFTKKIKYECRKTLADSRSRVKGRFARNGETEKSLQSNQLSHEYVGEDDEDDDNWLNFIDSFSANLIP